jgi:hypothetical protein
MIEPQLPEAKPDADPPPSVATARLLDTQALGHIGRRLLHQEAGGELIEDPVWRWSSAPDRYLDAALRLSASSAGIQLVDAENAPTIGVTLIAWTLESGESTRLAGGVELTLTAADHTVRTQVIRGSEPVSSDLPGNLAIAAGRLITSLATETMTRAARSVK